MGTERRGAGLLLRTRWMEPCAQVSATRALLRAGRSVHSLLPPPWELGPRLSELQTLDPTDSLPTYVTHAGGLSLATPTPQFSPWEGSLPWAPEATEKNTGGPQSKAPSQWPSTHKASSCTNPEDTVPPRPNASVSSHAPQKQLVLSRQP